jgi:hypothetical protein
MPMLSYLYAMMTSASNVPARFSSSIRFFRRCRSVAFTFSAASVSSESSTALMVGKRARRYSKASSGVWWYIGTEKK